VSRANAHPEAILVSMHYNYGGTNTRGPETFYWRMDSYSLAKRIQRELSAAVPSQNGNRGLVRRRIRLTRNPEIPCVLVEGGYLSQASESRLIADAGYRQRLAKAIAKGIRDQAAYGDAVTFTILENIAEGPDADRIMNKAVADGNKVLIAGSFGYQNGAMQIARRDPSVTVLHASGFMVAPNFSPFAAEYFQGTYLLGMAAASLSKTGKLGSVSAFAIPELITSINAFTLGAQTINPDVEVSVVWVNTWFDPAKEQEAAKALMAQGCDVIFSNAQDTPSVIAACEEAGVYAFNLNSSMKKYSTT
jgi:basic membrane lipoprotein Med (substrate-binding protein (PBP1-ABC) superfamily)